MDSTRRAADIFEFDGMLNVILKDDCQEFAKGLILYSAIKNGLLLDEDMIESFYSLDWLEDIHALGHSFWFNLKNPGIDTEMVWEPDDLTLMLINRYGKQLRVDKSTGWFEHVRALFRKFMGRQIASDNFELLAAMRVLNGRNYPQFVLNSMSNRKNNRGLSEVAHVREMTRIVPPVVNADEGIVKSSRKTTRSKELKIIASSVNKSVNSSELLKSIGDLEMTLPVRSVVDCAVFYFENKTDQGHKVKPSGILRLVNNLTDRFSGEFGCQDIESLNDADLVDGIESIISRADESSRVNLQKSANYYFWYLHKAKNRKYIVLGSEFKEKSETRPILVFDWEYKQIKYVISKEMELEISSERVNMLRSMMVALIIGYRIGLTRGEIEQIRVSDFNGDDLDELCINGHDNTARRSIDSNRVLDIRDKFEGDEFEFVSEFLEWVKVNSSADTDYIFAWSKEFSMIRITQMVFNYLGTAIKMVTGDPNSGFAAVRNAFASSSVAHMWLDDNKDQLDRDIENLSKFMGHALGETTLKNYVFSLDKLCLEQGRNMSNVFDALTLSNILGVDREAIYKKNRKADNKESKPLSFYRDMVCRQLVRVVDQYDLKDWVSIEDACFSLRYDFSESHFSGFVNDLKKHELGEVTIGMIRHRYPKIGVLDQNFINDGALYKFIVDLWSASSKVKIEKMMDQLSKVCPSEQHYLFYRWDLIKDEASKINLDGKTEFKTLRKNQAFDFLLKSLCVE